MPTDRQVKYIHDNRQRKLRARSIGELARKYVESKCFRSQEHRGKIERFLEAALGRSLASHCAAGECVDGVQSIYVDDPSLTYHLCVQEQEHLLRVLSSAGGRRKVLAVRFMCRPTQEAGCREGGNGLNGSLVQRDEG